MAVWWLVVHAAVAATEGRIDLTEALAQAAIHNKRVEVAHWATREAKAQAQQAANYLPQLRLSAGVQWWDGPIVTELVPADSLTASTELTQGPFADLVAPLLEQFETLGEPVTVREQRTTNLTAQAVIPITGMFSIAEGHSAARRRFFAARAKEAAVRDEIAVAVVEAYTDALAAAELVEVSDASVASLSSALKRANDFEELGLAQRTDVLQLEVAARNAEQAARQAQRTQALTERRLAMVVGSDAEALRPEPLSAGLPALPDLEAGLTRVAARADLEAASHTLAAARAGRRATLGQLLPQVAAVAQVERLGGVGALGVPQQAFVGLQAEFDVWGLGKRNAEVRQATARLRQAEVGLEAMHEGALLEARAAWDQIAQTREAVGVANVQITQAEENLRLVDARFAVQLATTADRLAAEGLVGQARIQQVLARHQVLAALAEWQRLTALPVDPGGAT